MKEKKRGKKTIYRTMNTKQIILLIAVGFALFATGQSLICYECNSIQYPATCGVAVTSTAPTAACTGYCVVYNNTKYNSGAGAIFRTCSTRVVLPSGQRENGTCLANTPGDVYYLCDSDMCNTAPITRAQYGNSLILVRLFCFLT